MPPLNLYARVRFSFVQLAHETAGAACTRSSLRPLFSRAEVLGKPRAHHAARLRSRILALVEEHEPNISHVIARSDSDEAIHASARAEGWIASLRSQ